MAIARVAHSPTFTHSATNVTSISRTLSAAATGFDVTAGSLLVAITNVSANNTITVSDDYGNTWTTVDSYFPTEITITAKIAYTIAASSGALTVTASSDTSAPRFLMVLEYTGIDTTTPLITYRRHYQTAAAGSAQQDPGRTGGDITTTGEAVFLAAAYSGITAGTATPGSGFTELYDATGGGFATQVQEFISSTAQTSQSLAWGESGTTWLAYGMAFAAASGASAVKGRSLLLGVG